MAIVGVVASGNLEVLVERVLPGTECEVTINTALEGFAPLLDEIVADFLERSSLGGLKLSINDGGSARKRPPSSFGPAPLMHP